MFQPSYRRCRVLQHIRNFAPHRPQSARLQAPIPRQIRFRLLVLRVSRQMRNALVQPVQLLEKLFRIYDSPAGKRRCTSKPSFVKEAQLRGQRVGIRL